MAKRAFHPCIYCGQPVSPERYESGTRVCEGPCAGRPAKIDEITARTSPGGETVNLPKCLQCDVYMAPRAIDGFIAEYCFSCNNSPFKKVQCMKRGHKGDSLVSVRYASYHAVYVSNPKSKDHGQTNKIMMCFACAATGRHETWDSYQSRTENHNAYDRETGECYSEGHPEELVLTRSPWDEVGGINNRWMPGVLEKGIGEYTFFNPLRFTPIEGVFVGRGERRRQFWALMCERLSIITDDKPETFIGSVAHSGVSAILRDICSPVIGSDAKLFLSNGGFQVGSVGKGERRKVMETRDVGWCFVGVRGVKDKKHDLLFSRYTDHRMHFPNHTLLEWMHYQLKGFSHR